MLFISQGLKLRLRCTIVHIWFSHHALKHKQENLKLVGVQQHYAEVHLRTYTFPSQSSQFDTSAAKQSPSTTICFLAHIRRKKEEKTSQNTLIQQNWFLFCVISPDKFVGIRTTFNLHDSLHSIIHLQVLVLFPAFHDSPVLVLFPAFHDSPVLVLFPAFHDSPVLVLFPAFHDSPVLVLFPTFHNSPVLVLFPTFCDLNSNLSLSFVPSLPSMIQRATCPPHLYECASQHCHPGNAGSVWSDQTSEASLKPNKKDLVLPLGDQIY